MNDICPTTRRRSARGDGFRTACGVAVVGLVSCLALPSLAGSNTVIDSPHNLSAAGPGLIRAAAEQEVCVFCHTPHNAAPIQPLWNRSMPVSTYTVYTSTSLDAVPGQPTGSSKLCLSCHDGTIALGSVISRGQPIQMAGGVTTLPPGDANLSTDLSDDHPISFRYDANLVAQDTRLKDPATLPDSVRLDINQELQCTSCHDAHDNSNDKFLVMGNSSSQLCNTCHDLGTSGVEEHNQCSSCHKPHTSPSGPKLLAQATASETCLVCHGGMGGGAKQGSDVSSDLVKISRHETNAPIDQPNRIPNQVTCSDCHESHTVQTASAAAPLISGKLGRIDGVNVGGAAIAVAQYEYEVCLKCHNGKQAVQSQITRQLVQADTRLEFSPSAISFHPVMAAGKNRDVPSLKPGLTTASLIYCTDCHASDTSSKAGGSGSDGPHGSNESPLLIARYDTTDYTKESSSTYALCYRCHERTSILQNKSFRRHNTHIVEEDAPCSVCHDAHGISSAQGQKLNNSHLINFDTNIVKPSKRTGTGPIFKDSGQFRGSCTLLCHGEDHRNASYKPMGMH